MQLHRWWETSDAKRWITGHVPLELIHTAMITEENLDGESREVRCVLFCISEIFEKETKKNKER